MTKRDELRFLIQEAFRKLPPEKNEDPRYKEQLEYEVGVIEDLGFQRVFLICHLLCEYAREQNIRMGPGRGSAAASVVCWLLGITELDPIVYDLDFSRFLIEGRVSPPDIDLDIERSGRERIMVRLKEIVGQDRICKITTISTLHEKGALRDAARVLEAEDPIRYQNVKHDIGIVCNMVGPNARPLTELINVEPIASYYRRHPKVFRLAMKFVGLPRQKGVHAAGVIVSDRPFNGRVPLTRDRQDALTVTPVCQWDMRDTERLGLFKLDLLVLDALDFISEACELANCEVQGLEPNDPDVLRAFDEGKVMGIFQFDAEYIADIFREIKTDRFEDLVATNALLRPGAKSTNSIQRYGQNKRKKKWVSTLPVEARECVADTYGLLLYQEQAMRLARVCAGFTVSEADDLRKGIAKDYDTSRMKDKFLDGCERAGTPPDHAQQLWKVLENAGRYMFNKAHSTCYSYLAYQMMWLKVHHPQAYWIAMLNADIEVPEKVRLIAQQMRATGAKIRGVRANRSKARCWYDKEKNDVVLGYLSIKGIGVKAAAELERLRNATSLEEWNELADRRVLNKKVREFLIKHNVFNCWSRDPNELSSKLLGPSPSRRGPHISKIYEAAGQKRLFP